MEKFKDFKSAFVYETGLSDKTAQAFFDELKRSFYKDVLRLAFKGVANGKSVRATLFAAADGRSELAAYYLKAYRLAVAGGGAPVKQAFFDILPALDEAQILRLKKRYFRNCGFFNSSAVKIINRIARRGGEPRAERYAGGHGYGFDKEKFVR